MTTAVRAKLKNPYPGLAPFEEQDAPRFFGRDREILPKQCPELNSMDHLRGKAKTAIAANDPFASVDELAGRFIDGVNQLSPRQAKLLASILSPQFWLKRFF